MLSRRSFGSQPREKTVARQHTSRRRLRHQHRPTPAAARPATSRRRSSRPQTMRVCQCTILLRALLMMVMTACRRLSRRLCNYRNPRASTTRLMYVNLLLFEYLAFEFILLLSSFYSRTINFSQSEIWYSIVHSTTWLMYVNLLLLKVYFHAE